MYFRGQLSPILHDNKGVKMCNPFRLALRERGEALSFLHYPLLQPFLDMPDALLLPDWDNAFIWIGLDEILERTRVPISDIGIINQVVCLNLPSPDLNCTGGFHGLRGSTIVVRAGVFMAGPVILELLWVRIPANFRPCASGVPDAIMERIIQYPPGFSIDCCSETLV